MLHLAVVEHTGLPFGSDAKCHHLNLGQIDTKLLFMTGNAAAR